MSRMADLHIDIITELSKTSKKFDEAIECGCNDCELYTIAEIEKQFKSMSAAWVKANSLRVVKAQS